MDDDRKVHITPEMAIAGARELSSLSLTPQECVTVAERVFRAMIVAFPNGECSWDAVWAAVKETDS